MKKKAPVAPAALAPYEELWKAVAVLEKHRDSIAAELYEQCSGDTKELGSFAALDDDGRKYHRTRVQNFIEATSFVAAREQIVAVGLKPTPENLQALFSHDLDEEEDDRAFHAAQPWYVRVWLWVCFTFFARKESSDVKALRELEKALQAAPQPPPAPAGLPRFTPPAKTPPNARFGSSDPMAVAYADAQRVLREMKQAEEPITERHVLDGPGGQFVKVETGTKTEVRSSKVTEIEVREKKA